MTALSPIVLFVCDRAEHTARTLEALSRNELAGASELTILCDGPRRDEDAEAVEAVRTLARETTGFKAVTVVERPEHTGADGSLIAGVTQTLDEHERVIVLDDDLITAPYFLAFMNEALDRYAGEGRVVSICGYTGPLPGPLPETYFLPGAHSWGWATWRRGWALFEHDPQKLLDEILGRDLIYAFDFEGAEPLTQFLADAIESKDESWRFRWVGAAVTNDKLTLYPGASLVRKAGLDGSSAQSLFGTRLATRRPRVGQALLEVDRAAFAQFRSLILRWRSGWSWKQWLYCRVAGLLPTMMERALYSALVRTSLRRRTAR